MLFRHLEADNLKPSDDRLALETILAVFKKTYQARGLELALTVAAPAEIIISKNNFEIVLANLLDNALQHGAKRVEIAATLDNGFVALTFVDNGNGISKANAERIFTPFFTTRREQGGTGLGLGIVRSIIEAHGGEITLHPDPSRTVFVIKMPTAPVKDGRPDPRAV